LVTRLRREKGGKNKLVVFESVTGRY